VLDLSDYDGEVNSEFSGDADEWDEDAREACWEERRAFRGYREWDDLTCLAATAKPLMTSLTGGDDMLFEC
jgi:hypothetical protein